MKCENAGNGKGFDMGKSNGTITWMAYWSMLGMAFGAGFGADIEGARNVATFAVFALAVLALFSCNADTITALAQQPPAPAWRRSATIALQAAMLGVLVWHGAILTAVAWLWVLLAGAVSVEMVRRKRAELRASQ
jgi:hypothetical protein